MSNLDRLTNRPARVETLTKALDPNDQSAILRAMRVRSEAQAAFDKAKRVAAAAPGNQHAEAALKAAEEALTAAQTAHDELAARVVTFTMKLRAVPVPDMERLLIEHRPTAQQKIAARALANGDPKAEPAFNPETYPPALVALSLVEITFSDDPGNPLRDLTADQIDKMVAGWSDQDREDVLDLVNAVSTMTTSVADLGKG